MANTIQVKVDDELKMKGFPVEIKKQTAEIHPYAPITEEEMLAKLEKSKKQGKYRDADDAISDMRSKYYGLYFSK